MSPNTAKNDEPSLPNSESRGKEEELDQHSSRGRFGWCPMENKCIPYIFRSDKKEKYVSVRMFQERVLNQFMTFLPNEMISFYKVQSYSVTEAESRLLNEINRIHSGFFFGKNMFNTLDQIVKLEDATEFLSFLMLCYQTVIKKERKNTNRCGFIKIGGESVIPFTLHKAKIYVPLFYLEDVAEDLKSSSTVIKGWDLAYLKFCCKLQGIKPSLFEPEECQVVPLDVIKGYFPPGTMFEDYWPQKHNIQTSGNKSLSHLTWTINTSAPANVSSSLVKPTINANDAKISGALMKTAAPVSNINESINQRPNSYAQHQQRVAPNSKRDAPWVSEAALQHNYKAMRSGINGRAIPPGALPQYLNSAQVK